MTLTTGSASGTGLLLRGAIRRDRLIVTIWLAAMAAMAAASAAATPALITAPGAQRTLALELNGQPALRALYGPILDPDAIGEIAMSKMTVLYALIASILVVVVVRRHTRVEEESGRAELVGGTVVGRDAPLAAAVMEGGLVGLLLGAVVFAGSALGGLAVAGSTWFALSWVGTAWVATGIAAVVCQLSASARTCAALGATALGTLYAVRAVGDGWGWTWLSWCSPLGWNTQLSAWSDPRGWVLVLYVVTSIALTVLAFWLRSRRDLGAGLLAARPGRADGAPWLGSPWGLTVRVHRLGFGLWAASMLFGGLAFGAMSPGLDDLVASMGAGQKIIDRLGGAMVAAVLSILAMAVTFFGVTVVASAGAEELAGHAETVLSTGVSRRRWFGATVVAALGGAAALVLISGAGLMIGYALAGGHQPWTALAAAGGWAVAVAAMLALVVALWSVNPRWALAGWGLVGLAMADTVVGEMLTWPTWIVRLSPYSALAQYPAQEWQWAPILVLAAVTVVTMTCAWFRLRSRDIG